MTNQYRIKQVLVIAIMIFLSACSSSSNINIASDGDGIEAELPIEPDDGDADDQENDFSGELDEYSENEDIESDVFGEEDTDLLDAEEADLDNDEIEIDDSDNEYADEREHEEIEVESESDEEIDSNDVENIVENDQDTVEIEFDEASEEDNLELIFPALRDCGNNDYCPPDAPICYNEKCVQCRSSDDCPQSLACISGHCWSTCSSDLDCCSEEIFQLGACTEKLYCHVETGRCRQCLINDHCLNGEICFAGSCLTENCFWHRALDYRTFAWCEDEEWVSYGFCPDETIYFGMTGEYPPCHETECYSFEYRCGGQSLFQCYPDGSDWIKIMDCLEYCDAEYGRCTNGLVR